MEINLKNKTAWVFGGSKGIGRAIAIQLSRSGANILLISRNKTDLIKTKEALDVKHGQNHDFISVDMSNIAKTLLSQLNYRANLFHGHGYLGLSQLAPFDKILVTCGAVEVPPLLLEQLRLGGEMVIPIGFKNQIMTLFSKDLDGIIKELL